MDSLEESTSGSHAGSFYPSARCSFADFLVECLDAVSAPNWDPEERGQHLAILRGYLGRPWLLPAEINLLEQVREEFESQMRNPYPAFFEDPLSFEAGSSENLVERLRALAVSHGAEQYLYHGTILGRIGQIRRSGLKPGEKPVWKTETERAHSDEAVYFSETWRGAAWWAYTAHLQSRGRRDGRHRQPVVIRIPADGLDMEKDIVATTHGCVRVRGTIDVSSGHLLQGELRGYPFWKPLG